MNTAGTLQEVVAFMALIAEVRRQCKRRITLILVHHENKGGAASGAWEGAGDTLLRVQAAGRGQTVVHVQKARWASEYHGKTLKLAWAPGDTFQLTFDRDLLPAVEELLSDGTWRTIDEIREHVETGTKAVRDLLAEHEDRFAMRTGEQARALGRSPKSHLYGTAQITRLTPESSRVESTVKGARESYSTTRLTLEESSSSSRVGSPPPNSTQTRSACFESEIVV